ncbi:MAG: HipA domain-containing protein [Lachnospiraceae bacterium]|nr:HipA domain-containing protein [Lachnospiraceae bacterium]
MHKRVKVADIELDDASGFIKKINTVYAPEHLPIGVSIKKGVADRASLNDWWTERSIPASRSGIREALELLDITSTKMLLVRCYGLSLSDQYWICPEGTNLTWDNINFFENSFSDDVGDVLFGAKKKDNAFDFSSPDNTSDGNLKKRWKIIAGKRCLVKGGSTPFRQQPFNEVIASKIMEWLGISHVPYTVMWNQGIPYSVCEDFITGETELIPAWRIMQTLKKENDISVYQHFLNCCEALGIKEVIPYLDRMIVLDYIIANEDRHLNNFGVIRNAETLEWIGMAPIYDSGSSLGYDKLAGQIRSERDITCKPFKKYHEEQLKLVSSFEWIDIEKLSNVRALIMETFSEGSASEYMDETRMKAIADTVEKRIRNVAEMAMSYIPVQTISTEYDVEKDIAEDYGPKMV